MFPLDPNTVNRLVELAIDRDGAFERTGRDLQQLLEHAGWPDEVIYDGSPKRQWLRDTLDEQADNRSALERFICRLCDPIEYNHTEVAASTAEIFRGAVNTVLVHERLAVTQASGRPVIVEVNENGTIPTLAMPANLSGRLAALIDDQQVVKFLVERADEAQRAESAGAYTLAVIGIGSFTEAHAQGWIEMDAKDFLQQVRLYRNYIHPQTHIENEVRFDSDSVMLCWGPIHAALNDLERSHARLS
jgi:hypothetical protein